MKHDDFEKKPKKLKHAKNIRGQGMRTLNEHQAEGWDDEDFDNLAQSIADEVDAEVERQILSEYMKKPGLL
jgi:hypothetical protein